MDTAKPNWVVLILLSRVISSIFRPILQNDLCHLRVTQITCRMLRILMRYWRYRNTEPVNSHAEDSWRSYRAAFLRNQTTSTVPQYRTHSHYPGIELISPCHILLISSAKWGSDKYQFCKSLVLLGRESNSRSPVREACTLTIPSPRAVK